MDELPQAQANLAHTVARPMVEGGALATVTGAAGMLRRARARCWSLPSIVSGHGWRRRVTGVLVEQLWWWRIGEGKLASVMATAALGAEAAAAAGEEGSRGEVNGVRG